MRAATLTDAILFLSFPTSRHFSLAPPPSRSLPLFSLDQSAFTILLSSAFAPPSSHFHSPSLKKIVFCQQPPTLSIIYFHEQKQSISLHIFVAVALTLLDPFSAFTNTVRYLYSLVSRFSFSPGCPNSRVSIPDRIGDVSRSTWKLVVDFPSFPESSVDPVVLTRGSYRYRPPFSAFLTVTIIALPGTPLSTNPFLTNLFVNFHYFCLLPSLASTQ